MRKKKAVKKDDVDGGPTPVSNNNNNNAAASSQSNLGSRSPTIQSKINNGMEVDEGVPRPFGCVDCGVRFTKIFYLQQHRRRHTGERLYQCSHCPKAFYRKAYLTDHEKYHLGQRDHNCDQCTGTFITKRDLNKHKSTHHASNKLFECLVCLQTFELQGLLNTHIRVVHGEKFECVDCKILCSTQFNLRKHFKTKKHQEHIQSNEGSPQSVEPALKLSEGSSNDDDDEYDPLQCKMCSKSFKSKGTLEKHGRSQCPHNRRQPSTTNRPKSLQTLKRVILLELAQTDSTKIHECPVCQRSFRTMAGFGKHIKCHDVIL